MSNDQGEFDLRVGVALKAAGMARAAAHRPEPLEVAKEIARTLARMHGQVTADDVQEWLRGTNAEPLGNAAGRIFMGKEWVCVGWRASRRTTNHGRMIRVWELKV